MAQRLVWAVAFGFALAVVGCGSNGDSGAGGSGGGGGTGGAGVDPCPQGDVGAWRPMANPDLSPPTTLAGLWPVQSFWNGKEMLLLTYDGSTTTDLAYDPCADSWRTLPAGAPKPAYGVHTGMLGSRLAIFVAGTNSAIGAWLDAEATTWTPMNMLGAPTASVETLFATDSILSFGGDPAQPNPSTDYATGTRYDLATDAWRTISVPTGLSPRRLHAHALIGDQLVVWGGSSAAGDALGDGAVYDLGTDSWKSVSSIGAPTARVAATVVSTGSAMVVWGGYGSYQDYFSQQSPKADGGIYELSSDTWKPITQAGAPDLHAVFHAVWTGKQLLLLGEAFSASDVVVAGGLYDPATDTWTTLQTEGAPSLQELAQVGEGLFVTPSGLVVLQSGYTGPVSPHVFDSGANIWTTATTTGAPQRAPLASVWTGKRLIDWGGADSETTGCGPNSPPGCDPYLKYTYFVDGAVYRVE